MPSFFFQPQTVNHAGVPTNRNRGRLSAHPLEHYVNASTVASHLQRAPPNVVQKKCAFALTIRLDARSFRTRIHRGGLDRLLFDCQENAAYNGSLCYSINLSLIERQNRAPLPPKTERRRLICGQKRWRNRAAARRRLEPRARIAAPPGLEEPSRPRERMERRDPNLAWSR